MSRWQMKYQFFEWQCLNRWTVKYMVAEIYFFVKLVHFSKTMLKEKMVRLEAEKE